MSLELVRDGLRYTIRIDSIFFYCSQSLVHSVSPKEMIAQLPLSNLGPGFVSSGRTRRAHETEIGLILVKWW